jgi:catalase
MPQTLRGRVIGCLAADGADSAIIDALRRAAQQEGAKLKIVAPHVGGIKTADGKMREADLQLDGGPSVLFDAIALIVAAEGAAQLTRHAGALDFVSDAFNHLKIIGYVPAAELLLARAGIAGDFFDEGLVRLTNSASVAGFVAAAKKLRLWDREPKVRHIP